MSGLLTHTVAYILRTRLINAGLGTVPDENRSWPIYVDGEPNTPDNILTIRDTSPIEKSYNQYLKRWDIHHGVQVRIRAKDIPTGHRKSNDLEIGIEQFCNDTLVIDSTTYILTAYVVSSLFLNRNPTISRLPLWTINVMLDIHQQ